MWLVTMRALVTQARHFYWTQYSEVTPTLILTACRILRMMMFLSASVLALIPNGARQAPTQGYPRTRPCQAKGSSPLALFFHSQNIPVF